MGGTNLFKFFLEPLWNSSEPQQKYGWFLFNDERRSTDVFLGKDLNLSCISMPTEGT